MKSISDEAVFRAYLSLVTARFVILPHLSALGEVGEEYCCDVLNKNIDSVEEILKQIEESIGLLIFFVAVCFHIKNPPVFIRDTPFSNYNYRAI